MSLAGIAAGIYGVMKAIPAAQRLFTQIQDLYYNELFGSMSEDIADYKGRRRAISNSIETASNDDDRRVLSLMLSELQERRHRQSVGTTDNS